MIYEDNYTLLVAKLRDFKRKYYRNQIIKGGIYFVAILLVSFLTVTALEFFGRFDTTVRTILFYSFICANVFIMARFMILPALSLFGLRKSLSYTKAADIIGRHFSEVKDKLLNTLQLKEQAGFAQMDPLKRELIEASVNQKITELRPIPFVKAVDYRKNRKYLKYALIPLAVVFIILWRSPGMLVQGTQRLVNHNKYFAIEAPFNFILKNDSLSVIRLQDFPVEVQVKGSELPAEVYLVVDGNPYKMNLKSKSDFSYTLRNVQKDMTFQFSANGFLSEPYSLKALPKPTLQKFEVALNYPAYINKKNDVLQNTGDITIPEGTTVNWKFYTENTEKIEFAFTNKSGEAKRTGENEFSFGNRFLKDDSYILKTSNKYLHNTDSIHYQVNVIPDTYPEIKVEQQQDSLNLKNMYFSGEVSDDYGLNKLEFRYHFTKSDDSARMRQPEKTIIVPISQGKLLQPFYYPWDLTPLNIKPGEEIEYYFQVWDNDGVNGSKFTRSQKNFFNAPSLKEIEQNAEADNKDMENKMDFAIDQAKQLQKEMSDMKMKLVDKKNLDWQDKKSLEDMMKKQQELKNTVEDIQKEYNKNLQKQNEFNKMDEQILEKHKELQKMFDQVMDEKTKKMFDELQKLLEQNDKDQVENQLDKMNFNDKELQKELDRMEQLYKKLEFEQKLQQTTDKLDTLAKKQDKLADETAKNDKKNEDAKQNSSKSEDSKQKDSKQNDDSKKGNSDADKNKDAKQQELEKKQDELNKQFDGVKKDLGDLEKKNENLDKKEEMPDNKDQQQDISQDMQQSEQSLQQQQNKKASKSQKSAAQKMKKMSKEMKDKMQGQESKEHEEDYQALRQLLENLLYVSFQQEDVMDGFKKTPQYNPHYVELGEKQRQLKDDSKLIEDSLNALSKRETEIKSYVNKEMGLVNFNMDQSISDLGLRNTPQAISHEQYAMTSLNNLALMLDEAMKGMQAQMQQDQEKEGKGSMKCKKPGKNSGPSMQTMEELQKELGEQIKKLKDGKQGGGQQMSKELAQYAARQEAIRRAIQKMKDGLEQNGNKAGDLGEIQKEMDQNEKDIVNRNITEETIKRQHDIETRMLESDKAERKQETDPQRESHTSGDIKNPNPPLLENTSR